MRKCRTALPASGRLHLGIGKLRLDSHETYIEEIEGRVQVNHQNSDMIESLKSVISEHEEVIAAYLYGSAARGRMRVDSDIDVGILLANDAALDYRYGVRMAGEIQSRCHLARDVDLRVLNRRPVRFLNQVLRYGKLVFVRDEKKRAEFETDVLKEYLDFKPFLREYDRERRRRLIYGD